MKKKACVYLYIQPHSYSHFSIFSCLYIDLTFHRDKRAVIVNRKSRENLRAVL